MRIKNVFAFVSAATLLMMASLAGVFLGSASQASAAKGVAAPRAKLTRAVAFDVSPALRSLPRPPKAHASSTVKESDEERGPVVISKGFAGDAAVQHSIPSALANIASPLLTFEGVSNADNLSAYGFRVAPPDTDGAVGPHHYVEMINLILAVYDKQGNRLVGPTKLGDFWLGFAVPDCTDPSGDPVVLYDKHADRWLVSQFTTRGPTFYNCVAVSQTADPTGAYFRYAFSSGQFFPDYPKYSAFSVSFVLTSRDFGPTIEYGISVYALEKEKMLNGDPNARMVHFFLDSAVVPIYLMGDGLLPADVDGDQDPKRGAPIPIVGTMDNNGPYGAPFDALNIFELSINWRDISTASLNLATQLRVAGFDATFPCTAPPPASQTRSCIPQPGTTRKIDILSYRQRPTWRLAYRKFDGYEAMVTNQSVQASPGMAGVRWYEIRRTNGLYSLFQQGTFAPSDGVHRWMGSIAMDRQGNMALGYSVSNATSVFPGIRYTGRLSGDALGQMTLGEAVLIDGSGSQLTRSSRWGDYTSMNVDPGDDCTFWYVNEYYTVTSLASWQTRIGSFQIPGCTSGH